MIKYRITYPNWDSNDHSAAEASEHVIATVLEIIDIKNDHIIIKNLNNDGIFDDAVNIWDSDLIAMYLGQENPNSGYPIFKFLHGAPESDMDVLRNIFPKIDQLL